MAGVVSASRKPDWKVPWCTQLGLSPWKHLFFVNKWVWLIQRRIIRQQALTIQSSGSKADVMVEMEQTHL